MILILGEPYDPHIVAVGKDLEARKSEYKIIDPLEDILLPDLTFPAGDQKQFTAIWDRLKPVAGPKDEKSQYIMRERIAVIRSLQLLHRSSRLMNPWLSTERARSKPLQLAVAAQAGFMTPRTYIGNDPDKVKLFVEECPIGAIAKSATWFFGSKGEFSFTKFITPKMATSRSSIAYSPLIYQEYIPKAFEIRVTMIGEDFFAAKIESQDNPKATIDWRRDQFNLVYKKFTLANSLKTKLRKIQQTLGLNFGAYDLIRTPKGENYFLEVNATGNWLWLENELRFPIANKIAKWLAGG